jgi:hypothetical protein
MENGIYKDFMDFKYDFAISYAGEDRKIADGIYKTLKELDRECKIFYAPYKINEIIGNNGETFFENAFKSSKILIVIFSENYKRKEWTRYEWDIIRKINLENRFVPIKIDNVDLMGLSSKIIYLDFKDNYVEIAEKCIFKLIQFEKEYGIKIKSEYEGTFEDIKNAEGDLDKVFQIVKDNRERYPLEDIEYPNGDYIKEYKIIKIKDVSYAKIKRLIVRIDIPDNLSKDEVIFNIKYCTAEIFNKYKPDALGVFVYSSEASNFTGYNIYNVASSDFAPYGKWEKAEEGFVYNLPIDKFDYYIKFNEIYFNKNS